MTPTGLIINVNGNNLNFNGGSFTYPWARSPTAQVLFNFGNADDLDRCEHRIAFEGALLAPLATVNFSSGHIDGALIASNYTGSAQVNYVGFNDPLPTYCRQVARGGTVVVATPEPGCDRPVRDPGSLVDKVCSSGADGFSRARVLLAT